MKQLRTLQRIWMAFLAAAVVMGAACWWLKAQAGLPRVDSFVMQMLTAVLVLVTVLDLIFVVWWFRKTWTPLCEGTLKRVWAGRLTSVEESQAIAQMLFSRAIMFMAMLESPAAYALILTIVAPEAPSRAVGGLLAASVIGLALFYRYGVQPATDIFRHVERITK